MYLWDLHYHTGYKRLRRNVVWEDTIRWFAIARREESDRVKSSLFNNGNRTQGAANYSTDYATAIPKRLDNVVQIQKSCS